MQDLRVLPERPPWAWRRTSSAEARCAVRVVPLLLSRRIRQPRHNVGRRLYFANGTDTSVYRETVIDRDTPVNPTTLVVAFTLRRVSTARMHRLFRIESELNTVLFAGFPGLVSKLWCSNDQHGAYRGIYDWDGASSAEDYVRSLWRVLALVSVPGSIHYRVVPGIRRDDFLADPRRINEDRLPGDDGWWRPVVPARA